MRTLRSRLWIRTGLAVSAVLLISGVLLYALIADAQRGAFDAALAGSARSLAAMMEQEGDKLEIEFDEAGLPEFTPSEHAEFYQVWLGDGRVRARSPSLQSGDLERVEGALDEPVFKSAALPDGRAGRLVGIRFTPRQEHDQDRPAAPMTVTMVIARATAELDATLGTLRWIMIVVGVIAVVVCVGALDYSVRRGLKPVGELAGQIGGIGASALGTRIEAAGVPGELLPVVDRLNDLLARLESAFTRERRFSADVAHELRTPLAGVRSMLEVALSKQRDPDAYRDAMASCLGVNQQMQQMMESLLRLARADANQLELDRRPVDLAAVIRECWTPLDARAKARRLAVTWSVQEPCGLESDPGSLGLILQNLLTNAVDYTDEGGSVAVESAANNGRVVVTVRNTGSTLSPGEAERVFDRFWRQDASRHATGEHCGLGLSLCKTLVEKLGGSIAASATEDGTFAVRVALSKTDKHEA